MIRTAFNGPSDPAYCLAVIKGCAGCLNQGQQGAGRRGGGESGEEMQGQVQKGAG